MYGKQYARVWCQRGMCVYLHFLKDIQKHSCSIQEQIVILFPSSPGTDTTLLSQQSGSVGNFTAVLPLIQPSNAPLLLLSSGHPLLLLSRAAALYLPKPQAKRSSILHCGGLLSYSMTSCLERSIKAMCYQMECILFCIWFAFELGGSELQRAVLWMWYKQS